MNTCTFEVEIPDWVKWITQDADGTWYGHEHKPIAGPLLQWISLGEECLIAIDIPA
jgi:hypothetical protein